MFNKTYELKNGKQLQIIRCGDAEIPYIKNLKNIMDPEVQSIGCMGVFQTTDVYFFKKLTAEDDYANLPISYGISSRKTIFLLAVIDGEIAGYIIAMGLWKNEEDFARKNISIFDIEVIRKYRRLGVASLLIESLKECAWENGYETIYSPSRTNSSIELNDNSAGIALYLHTGAIEFDCHSNHLMMVVLFGEEKAVEFMPPKDPDDEDDEIEEDGEDLGKSSYKWILI